MRIFAVYSSLHLDRKPAWLDDFRARYDEPYEYHITLKQPCYVHDEMIPEIKNVLQVFMATKEIPHHRIDLKFERLSLKPNAPKGGCIMIDALENPILMDLQLGMRKALSAYQNYLTPESSQWERDFTPHITIARHLSPERFEEAKRDLQEDLSCSGWINEAYLQVLDAKNAEEAKKLDNRTIFLL